MFEPMQFGLVDCEIRVSASVQFNHKECNYANGVAKLY